MIEIASEFEQTMARAPLGKVEDVDQLYPQSSCEFAQGDQSW